MTKWFRRFDAATFLLACCLYLTGACQSIAMPLAANTFLPLFGGGPPPWSTLLLSMGVAAVSPVFLVFMLNRWLSRRAIVTFASVVWIVPLSLLLIDHDLRVEMARSDSNRVFLLRTFVPSCAAIFAFHFSALAFIGWSSEKYPDSKGRPYRLYGLFLLGVLHGVMAYLFVVAPHFQIREQQIIFRGAIVALGAGWLALTVLLSRISEETGAAHEAGSKPTWWLRLLWLVLAGLPPALSLCAVAHISTELSPIPLMWAVPVSLLFLAWIVALSRESKGSSRGRSWVAPGLALLPICALFVLAALDATPESATAIGIGTLLLLVFVMPLRWAFALLMVTVPLLVGSIDYFPEPPSDLDFWGRIGVERRGPDFILWQIGSHLLAVALVCRVCIGVLVRTAPEPNRFVEWLVVSNVGAGACLMFVQIVPPLIFTTLLEYPITLGLAWVTCIVVRVLRDRLEPGVVANE